MRPDTVATAATMTDAWCTEQAIEALHTIKASLVASSSVAYSHLPVVVDHPARVNQFIVGTDERDHLPAGVL